jgi:hypothetical protein
VKTFLRILPLALISLVPFTLQAAPPADLLGQYLYFEEGPDDFLIFTNTTMGEERDVIGDIDAFTYTLTSTGPSSATLVVTYDVGEYDEWDLTWDGAGTGTFTREEYKDAELEDADTGRFVESGGTTSPPANFTGVRLEEAVELEDERFEFLTDTNGREFEPGDVDPFTYVYTPSMPPPPRSSPRSRWIAGMISPSPSRRRPPAPTSSTAMMTMSSRIRSAAISGSI